ncbi:MAG: bifunctional methylenetetrahydrofolate dehydrogenase/methenyltetrahydrofolate cyclohydrolase FolD [Pseudomonadota bacterium]|nr:bifunctional methylenetetrahydrofolate dehydrogenase/methenyltetrahydrofolate cyclohydrolase FolD [Pseudomonadota bacterium]
MTAIIDGKAIAAVLREKVAVEVAKLRDNHDLVPGLAVVLVGEDPASQVYVRNKGKQTVACGMQSFEHKLAPTASEAELLQLVHQLNSDPAVHGILVQLPLPDQIDTHAVINAIDPAKDVDGFHLSNVGLLATGTPRLVPCTPLGCMILLQQTMENLSGKQAVVVGRSNIVGKPMASLLLAAHCTVTIAHSRTQDLPGVCRNADILIAAVGRPQMITGDWIKPGAVAIDVGINRIDTQEGKTRLVGDVDFDSVSKVAGAVTPVPGGVGPMTIACLLRNTVQAACSASSLPFSM